MTLSVLGINHKTASVTFREQMAFNPERIAHAYAAAQQASLQNIIILSTCNRTEVYSHQCSAADVLAWLSQFVGLPSAEIQAHAYTHSHDDALTHMIRVASGLDSMILGEPQILGQLKQACAMATEQGQLSKKFTWIIEQVFSATKKVRAESKLGEQAVSLAYAAAKLSGQIFDDLTKNTLMLVAVGEMNQLVAKHVCRQGIGKVILSNRSEARARAFAQVLKTQYAVPVSVIAFDEIATQLHKADVLCSCTASLQPIIPFAWAKNAIKQRRYKPMLMIDLAIPRDIDSKVAQLDDIYHYTVDDLQHVLDENIAKRRTASVRAEVLVSQQVSEINTKQRLKDLGYFMADYKQKVASTADEVYAKAKNQLAQGEPPEAVMQQLTHQLTAKLSHAQFSLLREAASLKDRQTLDFIVEKLSEK